MEHVADTVAVGLALVTALLTLKAATVPVRDLVDEIGNDLQRQRRWACWAAVFAVSTAIALGVALFLRLASGI